MRPVRSNLVCTNMKIILSIGNNNNNNNNKDKINSDKTKTTIKTTSQSEA